MKLPPGCEIRCPGCAHRLLSAEESQAQKEDWLHHKLAPWQPVFAPLQGVDGKARWDYRNKLRLTTRWDDQGWRFGLQIRDQLIAIPRCPVHTHQAREAIRLLGSALPPGPVFPLAFYIQSGAQVTLVLKTHRMPSLDWLDSSLQQQLAATGIEGLWLHLHPAAGRRMFAKRGWHLLWGRPRSRDDQGLIYGPSAFQQVIPALYGRALDEAKTFLTPTPDSAVVDLYCGSGATLIRWLKQNAQTVGVELGGEAVECARQNASQAQILRGKCQDRIPQLRDWIKCMNQEEPLLFVNPPRTGIEPRVLDWIIDEYRPVRMAYLSCSAGTLRRDLDRLVDGGYKVQRITPYDFFPQTYHVETMALLQDR